MNCRSNILCLLRFSSLGKTKITTTPATIMTMATAIKQNETKQNGKKNMFCLNCVIPVMNVAVVVDAISPLLGNWDAVYVTGIIHLRLSARPTFQNMPFYWSITLIKKELNNAKSHWIRCLRVYLATYTFFRPLCTLILPYNTTFRLHRPRERKAITAM